MDVFFDEPVKFEISSDGQTWFDVTGAAVDLALDASFEAVSIPQLPRQLHVTISVRVLTLREVYYRYRAQALGWPRQN